MLNFFKNILIPVDFSIHTEVAIKKALELADAGCTIYLIFILNNSFKDFLKPKSYRKSNYSMIESKLAQWKSTIQESYSHISVCPLIFAGNNHQLTIERNALELNIDLIIVAKSSHHSWIPFLNSVIPSEIVNRTGISVLTVTPGSIYQKLKNIVVPISDELTRNKLLVLDTLNRKFFFKIHLVTFRVSNRKATEAFASTLLQTYSVIKRTIRFPVQYAMLEGANKAKAILNYSRHGNADSLLLYPETETKIGWMNQHISDVLLPASCVHILTIKPGAI